MDRSPADDHSRGVGERIWYLPETDRVRPVWRVVVPLVVGVGIYLGVDTAAWAAIGGTIQPPVETETSLWLLGGQLVAASGAIVGVLTVVSRLDRRPISVAGEELSPSTRWMRDFSGGVGIGIIATLCMIAVPITAGETTMTVDYSGVSVDSVAVGSVILVGLVASLLVTVVFQELLFRRHVIRTVADTVRNRPVESSRAVGAAVVASVVCDGGFVLLAGAGLVLGPEVVLPALLIGLLLAAGYVLTGRLGLPIGVHFGVVATQASLYQYPIAGGFRLPSVVVVDGTPLGQSVTASVRLQALRVLVGGLLVWLWVYAFYGGFRVEERMFGVGR